jgi:hypothetical protein
MDLPTLADSLPPSSRFAEVDLGQLDREQASSVSKTPLLIRVDIKASKIPDLCCRRFEEQLEAKLTIRAQRLGT